MPTYEFRCPKGHDFEKFYRSIGAAAAEVRCPACGETGERQMSAGGGLVFKGSGFYITDYGKDGKKAQAPVAGSGAATSESATSKDSGERSGTGKESGDAAASGTDASRAADSKSGGEVKPAPVTKAARESKSGTDATPAKKPKNDA